MASPRSIWISRGVSRSVMFILGSSCWRPRSRPLIHIGDVILSISEIATRAPLVDNECMKGLGERMRTYAQKLGMSDAEVARRLEVASSRYSKWTLDQREPDYPTLIRICAILACSPTDLLIGPTDETTAKDLRVARCASALAMLDDKAADVIVAMIEAAAEAARKA